MKTIEDKWDDITKAIRLTVEQASSFGYSRDTLTSHNALIPIAYYILKLGNPTGFVQSSKYKEDRDKMRKWLTSSLIKRSFSGQPDNVLRPIRELLRNASDGFPVDDIVTRFRGTPKSIEFTDADIENLLLLEYGEDHTFSVLSLLYPAFDFRRKFHEDHIFPKSSFRKPDLKKKGIPQEKWEDYRTTCNRLANLQLMEGIPNEEKHAQDFKAWLEKTYKTESECREYLRTNLIPGDIDLEFGNFLVFVKEREKAIKARLKEVLFSSKPQTVETS
jgi:hypothetical protein